MCIWRNAWQPPCAVDSGSEQYCSEHIKEKCVNCGKQATHECSQTGIQFVCCAPLCDDCTHGYLYPNQNTLFNLGGGHITKQESDAGFEQWAKAWDDYLTQII